MSDHTIAGTVDGRQAVDTDKDERKETVTASIASAVKTELSIDYDTLKESYVTNLTTLEIKNEEVGDGLWKGAHSGLSANKDNTGFPAHVEEQQEKPMDSRGLVKLEEAATDDSQRNGLRASDTNSVALPKKEEEEAPMQTMNVFDPHAFLNFETMEDKKVKYEQQQEDGRSSRSGSSEASTSSLKDESEEPETTTRKPGLPISIAHLPIANKEVRFQIPTVPGVQGANESELRRHSLPLMSWTSVYIKISRWDWPISRRTR